MYAEDYITVHQSIMTRRRNCFKIIGIRFLTKEAKTFLSNRVLNIWNYLFSNIIDIITLTAIKNRLYKYFDSNPQWRHYSLS